ncbi:MAG: pyrroloquinoline quinone-dependent dehydrogenase [Bryobacteraceae bacterium]
MRLRTLGVLALVFSSVSPAQVTFDRILHPEREPRNWLTYAGNVQSQHHSALEQITPENVKNLELKWVFQAATLDKFEPTPIVVNGVLYTVQGNDVVALDAKTGRIFWIFPYNPSPNARICCGRISRGLAILGDTLFLAAIDGHLVAVDAKNGKALWDTPVSRSEAGYSLTLAPLVVKDKVLVGSAGGEYGISGFLAAFDAKTGKQVWRFNTIAQPGEPGHETWAGDSWKHGGGSIWLTGSYDPDLNLTYWGVGNPGPDWNGDSRLGDNLYSASVVALDPDTGKLKWFYQFNPHNEFDWDAVQTPVLVDMVWHGRPRKLILWANRNGFFYVIDRTTGEFLMAKNFAKQNWNVGFDERGRPMMAPGSKSSTEGTLIYPGNAGATNWYAPSFDAKTGLFYLNTWQETASLFVKGADDYVEGRYYGGGNPRPPNPRGAGAGLGMHGGWGTGPSVNQKKKEEGYGQLQALDPQTGEAKWHFDTSDVSESGILTTDSNVLFTGNREGYFFALDAKDGKLLWKASVGGSVVMAPITYAVDAKQFVCFNAGNAVFAFGLREPQE